MNKEIGAPLVGECLYFSFHPKWSKLCTLLQTYANDAEMKKKFIIFDSGARYKKHLLT
jgi:hypothetical protein